MVTELSEQLMHVDVELYSRSACVTDFGVQLEDGMICATSRTQLAQLCQVTPAPTPPILAPLAAALPSQH